MRSPTSDANFGFWFLTIPKNSEKKLEMENDSAVYHVSNATLGNKVSDGRTTVSFKSNGKKAPICNLVDNTLENASLDLIVSQSMNASFVTKGPNAVTVSGYVQPLVDESDNVSLRAPGLPVTKGADGAVEVKLPEATEEVSSSEVNKEVKASDAKATEVPVEPKPKAMDIDEPKEEEKAKPGRAEESKPKLEAKEEAKPSAKEELKPEAKEEDKPRTEHKKPKSKEKEKVEVKRDKKPEKEEKSEEKTATLADKKSLKRKLDEAEATDIAEPEKKRNQKKKKKKKNIQKSDEEAAVSKVKGAREPIEDDKALQVKPVVKEKSDKVVKNKKSEKDKDESNKMEVEEAAKEKAKEPKREAKAATEKPVEDNSIKETPVKAKAAKESKLKPSKKSKKKMIKAGKGVTYRVLKKGKAGVKPAKKGDSITLLYVGCLKDGTQFDKNLKDGLTFKIGGEEVIPGIELGVMGMCPKEKRRIVIPPEQGYGEDGASEGKIPPNAELHFTVQRK